MNSFSEERRSSENTRPNVILPSPERPTVSEELATRLAELNFNIQVVKIEELKSYGDRNFYLQTTCKTADGDDVNEYVLKILNHVDTAVEGMVEAQNEAMLFLKKQGLNCPVPVLSSRGSYVLFSDCSHSEKVQVTRDNGSDRMNAVRLMRYLPGEVLKNVNVLTEDLLFDLGQYIGKMDKILKDFDYPFPKDGYSWDLAHLTELQPYITTKYLGSKDHENLIMKVYNQYLATVPQVLQDCPKQVIHNDISEANIIVTQNPSNATSGTWSIAGVIDFGDMCYSYRVFEIAIAMADMLTLNYSKGNPRAFESVGRVLKGYQSIYPLSDQELAIVYWCIAGRFIQTLIFTSKKISICPDNEYVEDLLVKVRKVLPEYLKFSDAELLDTWIKS